MIGLTVTECRRGKSIIKAMFPRRMAPGIFGPWLSVLGALILGSWCPNIGFTRGLLPHRPPPVLGGLPAAHLPCSRLRLSNTPCLENNIGIKILVQRSWHQDLGNVTKLRVVLPILPFHAVSIFSVSISPVSCRVRTLRVRVSVPCRAHLESISGH